MAKLLLLAAVCYAQLPELRNTVPLEHAAVAALAPALPGSTTDGPSLLLTTFYPFGKDSVQYLPDALSAATSNATLKLRMIEDVTVWPNQASPAVPGSVPGYAQKVVVAGGFFVSPSKSTGTVDIFDVSAFPSVARMQVSEDKKANFYHHTEWLDVDGDGKLDLVGARCFKSMNPLSKPEGELVWFKQPDDPTKGPWKTEVLADGPDVAFTKVNLDGGSSTQFVVTQFFTSQQLAVFSCSQPLWSACANNTGVSTVVIDRSDGPFFNVQWVDLNGDGKKEILATTNEANGKGAVYAYEQPANWRTDPWKKHVLATGYKPKNPFLPGQGAPGSALAFDLFIGPHGKSAASTPYILVSGDDMGIVDLLAPRGDAPYAYDQIRIINSTGTVGTPAVHSSKGEATVLFVPLFAENKLGIYSF